MLHRILMMVYHVWNHVLADFVHHPFQ